MAWALLVNALVVSGITPAPSDEIEHIIDEVNHLVQGFSEIDIHAAIAEARRQFNAGLMRELPNIC